MGNINPHNGLVQPLNPELNRKNNQNLTYGSKLSLLLSKTSGEKIKRKKKIFGPDWQAKKYLNNKGSNDGTAAMTRTGTHRLDSTAPYKLDLNQVEDSGRNANHRSSF